MIRLLLCLFSLFGWTALLLAQPKDSTAALLDSLPQSPSVLVTQVDTLFGGGFSIVGVSAKGDALEFSHPQKGNFYAFFKINEEKVYLRFDQGKATHPYNASYEGELLSIKAEDSKKKLKETQLWHLRRKAEQEVRVQAIPLWMSLLPPLVAIVLALLTKQVLLSLFLGIFSGAWLVSGMPLEPYYFIKSVFKVLDTYILKSIVDSDHASVLIFSMIIGGVVALISRNGGMAGIVQKLSPYARGPKSTQFVAWLLGIAIFFDDYANSLIVGNTIRPISDRYGVTREKLAYIVDSTAAPVAAIAFITTWIGAELGYISDAFSQLEGMKNAPGAYGVFLNSLNYSFYSYFTLIFILFVIFSGRDFGPMFKAERRARAHGVTAPVASDKHDEELEDLNPVKDAPLRWINGLLPVLVIIFGTLWGLLDTGMDACFKALKDKAVAIDSPSWGAVWAQLGALEGDGGSLGVVRKLGIIVGNANSYKALLWASLAALLVAILLTTGQRIMRFEASVNTAVKGFKTMFPALLILILAWALATTTKQLSTADFLTLALGDSVNPYWMPVIVFILAALISFSTGSSWSTMAILYPIAIPMTWTICLNNQLDQAVSMEILYNVIAVVLSASVMGDHCSPISDTTILSSLASNCNHVQHVNTQLPYALTVGLVSIIMTYLATALGLGLIINLLLGLAVLWGILLFFGKKA
jgi:Na+/H+ antiporter NhaC